jgi:uncharacterized protein (TIGR00297 family)
MGEEMHRDGWRKAISPQRDRAQSRVLVSAVGALLLGLSVDTLLQAIPYRGQSPFFVFEAFGISVVFALVVVVLRAATVGGAACGGMICLLVSYWTGSLNESIGRSGLAPLALLFLLTFFATRAGRQRKAMAGLAEEKRGRNAAQIIANLSAAGLGVSPLVGWALHREADAGGLMKMMCLAALVEATADTVSSEIGQAFGGTPVMLTTLRRVSPGTDGAVSMVGSAAGIFAGTVVAVAGSWAMHLRPAAAGMALAAGICGLFFDSLLGATFERRGWLGNDLVNFASTAFAAAIAAIVAFWLLP